MSTYLDAPDWVSLAAVAARLGVSHAEVLRRALALGLPLLDTLDAERPGMPEWETALHLFPLSREAIGDRR